jgi:hypothetical protein
MTRPTHRRRVPEEKGLMARSMVKSSTIGAGIHGGAAPRRSSKATAAGRIWDRAAVTTVVVDEFQFCLVEPMGMGI